MRHTHAKARSIVLAAVLVAGLAAGTTTAAVAATTAQASAGATGSSVSDPVEIPISLGKPTPGATDNWQVTESNDVGYAIPAGWTGREIVGDGGSGHQWDSRKVVISNEFGDLHWRILVQSPFVNQEMPDPQELNEAGFHASSIEVEGASQAVLVAAQTGHWADPSVKTIDFQVYVESASTGVVSRFMGELPPGKQGKFLLNNFVPTIQP